MKELRADLAERNIPLISHGDVGCYSLSFLEPFKQPACADPIWSPMTDEEVMTRTLVDLAEGRLRVDQAS